MEQVQQEAQQEIVATSEEALEATSEETLEEPSSKEESKEEPKEEQRDDRFGSRFAILSRRERALKQRADELKALEDKYKRYDGLEAEAKKNPLKALEALGLDYNQLTSYVLNDGKPTEDMEKSELRSRLDMLEGKLSEREQMAAQAQYEETVRGFQGHIEKTLSEADYPLLKALPNAHMMVYDLIDSNYRETSSDGSPGRILDIDEAAKFLENDFEKQISIFLKTEKGQKLAESMFGQEEEKEEKQPPRTITNKRTDAPISTPRKLSDEESKAEIAKMLVFRDD